MKKSCLFCKKHNKVHVICELEETYFFTGQKLVRPSINWLTAFGKSIVALLFGYIVATVCTCFLSKCIGIEYACGDSLHIGICIATLFAITIAKSKSIMIFIIHVYQRYAPYTTRATCLFIPNCSDYMILAIQKYGTIKGTKKGLARFNRCEPPNGGIDYP